MKKFLLLLSLSLILLALFGCSCEKEEKFTVKFTTYTDVAIEKQEIIMDGLVAEPNDPMERAGYRFLGWYNGLKKWNFEKDTVTENITLTAKWEKYLSYMPAGDGSDGLWVVGCDFDVENVVIPREYSKKQITGINMGFTDRKNIKTIVIPSSVTYISASSFAGCDSLTTIYCEAESMPSGWEVSLDGYEVIWGHGKAS